MKNTLFLLALLVGGFAHPTRSLAQAPSEKQFQAIEKLMAPERKKVLDILEADKTGQYKTYKAEIAAIAKEKDPARQQDLISKLERDHLLFIRKVYAGAKINNEILKDKISDILGSIQFEIGEFADIQIDYRLPDQIPPPRFDVTLNCPFDAIDENDNGSGAAACDAEAFDCTIRVESLGEIVGGCRSKGDVGANVVTSAGPFTKMTVVAQSDISFRGFAAAIAGYAQINAKFGIRFRGPGVDKTVMVKEVFAFSPLIWFALLRGEVANLTAQSTFTGNFPAGTSIKAQVHTEVFALAVPAFTLVEMDANTDNIDFIRITGSN